ncbi:MAG: helix-turn-helix transcriptional regulator [Desulfitobacterium sp.]
MNKAIIAKKLTDLRGDKSREQVAVDLGISYSAIVSYESGERIPRDEIKIKLANYYKTTVADIFFSDNDTKCVV